MNMITGVSWFETETVCTGIKFGLSNPGGVVLKKTTHLSSGISESSKNGQRHKEGQPDFI
jgi:hypothetical protein